MSGLCGFGTTAMKHLAWWPRVMEVLKSFVRSIARDGQAYLTRCHGVLLGPGAVELDVWDSASQTSSSVRGEKCHWGCVGRMVAG